MNLNTVIIHVFAVILCVLPCFSSKVKFDPVRVTSIFDFTVKDVHENVVPLEEFRGNVTLIVNVAAEMYPDKIQYTGLMKLKKMFYDKGLQIIALPSRQWAELPDATGLDVWYHLKQNEIEFDLFMAQGDMNGVSTVPLYKYLKYKAKGLLDTNVMGKFDKFLVDKSGTRVKEYSPRLDPRLMLKAIRKLIREK